jgi:hypothetical protein
VAVIGFVSTVLRSSDIFSGNMIFEVTFVQRVWSLPQVINRCWHPNRKMVRVQNFNWQLKVLSKQSWLESYF